jgi:hypothetical protein
MFHVKHLPEIRWKFYSIVSCTQVRSAQPRPRRLRMSIRSDHDLLVVGDRCALRSGSGVELRGIGTT